MRADGRGVRRARAVLACAVAMGCIGAAAPAGALAGESRPLYRGVRATAMGGAFSAIADGEEAIFINPAGLAGARGLTFNFLAVQLEASTDLIGVGTSGLSAFSDLSGDTLNAFMGKNLYAHAQVTPSLVMPNFGISLISDHQLQLSERNESYPAIGLGKQSTNGVQAAFGASVFGRKAERMRSDLRLGVAAKLLWRRGGYRQLGFLDMLELTQDPKGFIEKISGDYERGIGVDLGAQYLFRANRRLTLSSALTMTDVGDTTFGGGADPQKSDFVLGIGASYDLGIAKASLAYDCKHLLQAMDFRRRNHFGAELALPFVSLYGGLYQMALTYGASVDVWLLRVTAASYSEEQGTLAGQDPERRYALNIAWKFGF